MRGAVHYLVIFFGRIGNIHLGALAEVVLSSQAPAIGVDVVAPRLFFVSEVV